MNTVESKIRSIVEQIDGVTYLYDNWQTSNIKADNEMLPIVLNVLPVSGSFNVGRMQMKDYPNCLIAFMDKADFDFNGQSNDEVIERCKSLAKLFVLKLNRSGLFEPVTGDIPYSLFYDRLDVNVTGVCIELRLKETNGIILCPTKSDEEVIYGRSGLFKG